MPWNCCCKNALNVVAPAVGDLPPEDMQANITSFDNVTSKVNTKHMNAMESYQEHETFEEFKLNPIYLPFGKLLPIKASGDRDELGDTSKLDKSIVADPNTTLDESSVAGSYYLDTDPNTTLDESSVAGSYNLDTDPNTTLDESSVAGPKIRNRTI